MVLKKIHLILSICSEYVVKNDRKGVNGSNFDKS